MLQHLAARCCCVVFSHHHGSQLFISDYRNPPKT